MLNLKNSTLLFALASCQYMPAMLELFFLLYYLDDSMSCVSEEVMDGKVNTAEAAQQVDTKVAVMCRCRSLAGSLSSPEP